jgi:hypothetical protein
MSARKKMPEPWPPDFLLFGEKACTACGATLPACSSHFVPDKTQRDGLSTRCRDCRNAADHRRWPDRKAYREMQKKRALVGAEDAGGG